jgi:hypothetical protein
VVAKVTQINKMKMRRSISKRVGRGSLMIP